MVDLPYNGFDPHMPYANKDDLLKATTEDAAWDKLNQIQQCLWNNEPLPPELAAWLGEAIKHSNKNTNEFTQRLGISRRTGERGKYSRQFKQHWQSKLWDLSTYRQKDTSDDKIIKAIGKEMELKTVEPPPYETLREWLLEIKRQEKRNR